MPLIDIHAEPSVSTRKWFGISSALAMCLVAWLLSDSTWFPYRVVAIGGLLSGIVYYLLPSCQLGLIRFWQIATFPIAWTMGHVLLSLIYFGILTPMAIIARWLRYDPLGLREDGNNASSSWRNNSSTGDPAESLRQY